MTGTKRLQNAVLASSLLFAGLPAAHAAGDTSGDTREVSAAPQVVEGQVPWGLIGLLGVLGVLGRLRD